MPYKHKLFIIVICLLIGFFSFLSTVTAHKCTDNDNDGYAVEGGLCGIPDCDDHDDTIHPKAVEICDSIDNDCNGIIDDQDTGISDQGTWYADTDSDSYGDFSNSTLSCSQPGGFVGDDTDCDDTATAVNPGASEVWYDGADQDCDGKNDYDQDMDGYVDINWNSQAGGSALGTDDCNDTEVNINPNTIWYEDSDTDGHGSPSVTLQQCTQPTGYVFSNSDCDDTNNTINPAADEVCDDTLDNDCNGLIDAADFNCSCIDTGNISITYGQTLGGNHIDLTSIVNVNSSENLLYTVTESESNICDIDANGTYFEAENFTNTMDGSPNFIEDISQESYFGTGYLLADGANTSWSCPSTAGGQEYSLNFSTPGTYKVWVRAYALNRRSNSVFIGVDGICAGSLNITPQNQWTWTNTIWNGQNTITVNTAGNHTVNLWIREANVKIDAVYVTTGKETPTDAAHGIEIDPNNCIPLIFSGNLNEAQSIDATGWTEGTKELVVTGDDETCGTSLTPANGQFKYVETCSTSYFSDLDGDGYGNSNNTVVDCLQPGGYVSDNTDCDDTDANINPATIWYEDADTDRYGNTAVTLQQCSQPAGYVLNNSDCNDGEGGINPGSIEICDNVDNNCDSNIDEGVITTYYQDIDTDTYGNAALPQDACIQPAGYVPDNRDCDDNNAGINPGVKDTNCNNIDEDCDGIVDEDYVITIANCGYSNCSSTGLLTCLDGVETNTCVPGSALPEGPAGDPTCYDSIDNDCDGETDSLDTNCIEPCLDNDGDGYGNPGNPECPNGPVIDCNDNDPGINPDHIVNCDSTNNNCYSYAALTWKAPVTNVDESDLIDLAGYRIYYGERSDNYTEIIDIGNNTCHVIGNLTPHEWCFVVTAYDIAGNESAISNEVCKFID